MLTRCSFGIGVKEAKEVIHRDTLVNEGNFEEEQKVNFDE